MALVSVPFPVVILPQHNITQSQGLTSAPAQIFNPNIDSHVFAIYCKVDQASLQVQVNAEMNPGVN